VQVTISALFFNPRYQREAARLAPKPVPPEFRLEMALIAAPLYVVAFFWFGYCFCLSISAKNSTPSDGRLPHPSPCGHHWWRVTFWDLRLTGYSCVLHFPCLASFWFLDSYPSCKRWFVWCSTLLLISRSSNYIIGNKRTSSQTNRDWFLSVRYLFVHGGLRLGS
jgi:hypothetical protein